MKLQQILVNATHYTDPEQNVIIARTQGIKDDIAQKLALWGTVRTGLLPRHFSSTFFARLNRRHCLLGRSFVGGYDSHGDRALYSQIVLLNHSNLLSFQNNAIRIARLMNSAGAWILNTQDVSDLPEIELPDQTLNAFEYVASPKETEHILNSMKLHDRVGLTDATEPLAFMGAFLDSIDVEQRAAISFSIGRRFLENAPFKISFYPSGDIHLEQELITKQVYPIRLRQFEAHYFATN